MDCTVFEWETPAAVEALMPGMRSRESRAVLGRNLRLVYPAAVDDTFHDLLKALDKATNDR